MRVFISGMGKTAENIREAMRDSGKNLMELAEETGVSHAILSRFMRYERGITLETAEKLLDVLGLEVREKRARRQ